MDKPKFVTEWINTDPDSYQWLGGYSDEAFQFLDVVSLPTGRFAVASAVVDITWYDCGEVDDALRTFGYECFDDLVDEYGCNANRLLAEFLFEYFHLFDPYCWIDERFDSFDDACWFIDRRKQWCSEHKHHQIGSKHD